MLRFLRHHFVVRFLAVAMHLCVASLSTAALFHVDDDVLCNPVVVLHDHNAHHMGEAKDTEPEPNHCYICHNLSLRSLVETVRVALPVPTVQTLAVVQQVDGGVTLDTRRPARAPPQV